MALSEPARSGLVLRVVAFDGVNTVFVNNSYGDGIYWQPPRTVRLSVQYDY